MVRILRRWRVIMYIPIIPAHIWYLFLNISSVVKYYCEKWIEELHLHQVCAQICDDSNRGEWGLWIRIWGFDEGHGISTWTMSGPYFEFLLSQTFEWLYSIYTVQAVIPRSLRIPNKCTPIKTHLLNKLSRHFNTQKLSKQKLYTKYIL